MAGKTVTWERVSKDTFFDAVSAIKYRADDIKEAYQFGCDEISHCYTKADQQFARYFIVYESERPIATVMLERKGNIVFFISEEIKSHIGLIRALKELSRKTVRNAGPIFTKTAYWYKEAQKMNKVIGFKPIILKDDYGIYILDE